MLISILLCLLAASIQEGDAQRRTYWFTEPLPHRNERIPVLKTDVVRVDVYYETNCPDSMRFVTSQLSPVYKALKSKIDLHMIPYGKATESFDVASGKYIFRCQHGPPECRGNTVQSCAIHLYPNADDHLSFIDCMESYPRPSESGQKCARRLSLDWKRISKCAEGDEGNRLLHSMAAKTQALSPRLTFVPTIAINKDASQFIQNRALRDLKSVVCDHYSGSQC